MRKLIVNDGNFDRELQLVERLVIGRDPECDLSDTNTLLSRRHAEFVANGTEVLVRDLGSRNGVFINGARVAEGAVRPGDVVRVGHFSIRYVEAADFNDPRRTEATVAFPVPYEAPEVRPGRLAVAPAAPSGAAPAAAGPVVARVTRTVPLPSTVPEIPAPAKEKYAAPAAAAEGESARGFVLARVAAAAIVGFLAAAIPLLTLQARAHTAGAEQQAEALAQWLGAEASRAIGSGTGAGASADAVSRQPGVVSAAVLSVDGTILSPKFRSGETVGTIPGINLSADDVRTVGSAWSGTRLDVVRPIESADGRRVGVAWISFEPSGSLGVSTIAIWLGFPIVFVLLISWVAADLISRRVASVRKA
jgi:hypothetical protein